MGMVVNQFHSIGALLCLLIVFATHADGNVQRPHQFHQNQCAICHETVDGTNKAIDLPPVSSDICIACHPGITANMSHPVDIVPGNRLPPELPLVNDRLSCLTCHVVHPTSLNTNAPRRSLLRKPGRGAQFCTVCHLREADDHTLFEKAHPLSRSHTDRQLALDAYTLQCAQCHDRHLRPRRARAGSGRRRRSVNGPGKHPVGVALADVAAKNPKRFNPPVFLSEQMRLYDGRIGCGTCHSAYSKEKNMLVTDNRAGGLCLQCHIK